MGHLLFLSPAAAKAISFQLEATGPCPSTAQLELAARRLELKLVHPVETPAWVIQLAPLDHGVGLKLKSPEGQVQLERMLQGRECSALAEAAVLIVQAHFMELAPLAPSPVEDAQAPPPVNGAQAPSPTIIEKSAPSAPIQLNLGITGAMEINLTPQTAAPQGQLQLSLQAWRLPLRIRLVFGFSGGTTQRSATDRVQLQQSTIRLDGALFWRSGSWWLQPALGGGVALLTATALDLEGRPGSTRTLPVIGLTLTAGRKIWRSVSLGAELSGQLLPITERYLISPVGAVAHSPGAQLTLGLGLFFDVLQ